DYGAVRALDVLADAHDHRLHHLALLHPAARDRLLHRHDDHVADGSVFALRPAQHLDAHDATCAGIICDSEVRLHLNHAATLVRFLGARCAYTTFFFFSPSITSQRLSLDSGRRSSILTTSP